MKLQGSSATVVIRNLHGHDTSSNNGATSPAETWHHLYLTRGVPSHVGGCPPPMHIAMLIRNFSSNLWTFHSCRHNGHTRNRWNTQFPNKVPFMTFMRALLWQLRGQDSALYRRRLTTRLCRRWFRHVLLRCILFCGQLYFRVWFDFLIEGFHKSILKIALLF